MSTPSIATATLPSASHHQLYNYQPAYSANALNHGVPTSRVNAGSYAYPTASDLIPNASHPSSSTHSSLVSAMPQSHPQAQAHAASTQSVDGSLSSPSLRRKQTDWNEFYKNGLPEEVIVIDDDTPPPPAPSAPTSGSKKTQARRPAPVTKTSSSSNLQPAAKKRRTGGVAEVYSAVYDRPSYSHHPQQYGDDASAATHSVSTDRTASLHTTAPTSLGSHASLDNGFAAASATAAGVSYEDANVGQKRKRVTRKTARDEQANNQYDYISPAKPLIKSGEVHVPVIREVSHDFNVHRRIYKHLLTSDRNTLLLRNMTTMTVTTSFNRKPH